MNRKVLVLLAGLLLPVSTLAQTDDACLDAITQLAVAGMAREAERYSALINGTAIAAQNLNTPVTNSLHNFAKDILDGTAGIYLYNGNKAVDDSVTSALFGLQQNGLCTQF